MNSTWILYILGLVLSVAFGVLFFFNKKNRTVKPEPGTREEIPDSNLPASVLPESVSPAETVSDPIEETVEKIEPPEKILSENGSDVIKVPIDIFTGYISLADLSVEKMDMLESLTETLPKLPQVSVDLLPVLASPGAGMKEIGEILERDQATVAKILRWVNSSFYGLENKVDSLHRAVTILGIDTLRSAVLEDSLGKVFVPKPVEGLSSEGIYRHAAAVSIISRHIAKSVRGVDPNVVSTAGLLHDIGLLLMLVTESKELGEAVRVARERHEPFILHEDRLLGFNHQIWGEVFVRAWRIPIAIGHAIGIHHSPARVPLDPIAVILFLADYISFQIGFGCPVDLVPCANPDELSEIMLTIGMKPPLERFITDKLMVEIIRATRFLHAAKIDDFEKRKTVDTIGALSK